MEIFSKTGNEIAPRRGRRCASGAFAAVFTDPDLAHDARNDDLARIYARM